MQVKSEVIDALRVRARPFETHVSNPASEAAYRQLNDQIKLLEETPGETVADVQSALRAMASAQERERNKKALIAGGLFLGLATSLALCGGPSSNGWIQGLNVLSLMAGAGCAVNAVGNEEARRGYQTSANSLSNLEPAVAASSVGNLRGTVSVSLDGPPSLSQLRDLLASTRETLERMPQPEFEAARKQVDKDLKSLRRYTGPTLAEARQQAEARSNTALKVLNVTPWTLGAGVVSIFCDGMLPGLALVGAGLIAGTAVATFSSVFVRGFAHESRQALDRWEPQLQALRDIDTAGAEMREWGKEKSAGVLQTEGSVVVGGVRIPLKSKSRA